MMLPKLSVSSSPKGDHLLFILPAGKQLPPELPGRDFWQRLLKRKDAKAEELTKSPVAADLADGKRAALVMIDPAKPRFEQLTALRKATMLLLDELPKTLAIVALGVADSIVQDAVYVALVNGVPLPVQKKKPAQALKEIYVAGRPAGAEFSKASALARANLLARELTALPPNQLDPLHYRQRLRALAREKAFTIEEYDFRKLKKMGAGAFCAVAQGSDGDGGGAAIVHLSWRPKKKMLKSLALVGKGICYDTGGHNLKPAKYMAGMHEDMNGSAVALSILVAAAELHLPVAIDCWLAIAKNHLSPTAYAQGDIVKALNGTTIEVVHTDAEGRMVLADTLALAAKQKPALMIDFATLTGSMLSALGQRYSGVFASDDTRRASCRGRQGQRRTGLRIPAGCRLRAGARLEGGRHQAMHARGRCRPHSRGAFPRLLRRQDAMDSHGSVGIQLHRRIRRRGHRPHRLRRQLGRGFIALLGRNALSTSSRVSM